MEQKLSEALLSLARKIWNDLDENDVIFIVDKDFEGKEDPDTMFFGIGIKGLSDIQTYYLNTFPLGLRDNEKYHGIDRGFWTGYTFKDGYGILYFLSSIEYWNLCMRNQERDWKEFDLFGKKKSFLSKCLSWWRNITAPQVIAFTLIANTLLFATLVMFAIKKGFEL